MPDDEPAKSEAVPVEWDPFPRLIGVKDVVARLGCKPRWLLPYLRKHPTWDGRPTHRKLGGVIRFAPEDVQTLIESCAPQLGDPAYWQPEPMRARLPPPRGEAAEAAKWLDNFWAEEERKKVEAKKRTLTHLPPAEAKEALEKWLALRKKHSEAAKAQHARASEKPNQEMRQINPRHQPPRGEEPTKG